MGKKIKGEIEEYVEKHFVQINTHSYSVCGVLFLYMYSKKNDNNSKAENEGFPFI